MFGVSIRKGAVRIILYHLPLVPSYVRSEMSRVQHFCRLVTSIDEEDWGNDKERLQFGSLFSPLSQAQIFDSTYTCLLAHFHFCNRIATFSYMLLNLSRLC